MLKIRHKGNHAYDGDGSFFQGHHLATFGDLGGSLKAYVQSYQSRSAETQAINSISDMKKFVEEYPEFRSFLET